MFSRLGIFFFLSWLSGGAVLAQTGGAGTFSFLRLVAPARPAALGGNAIATRADDVTLTAQNPALLSPEMDQQISLSYVGHIAGIRYGNVMAAKDLKKAGAIGFNLHYISYGTFDQTNVNAEKTGTFTAGEYAFHLSWSKALDSTFFIGTSVKAIFSNFADNTSNGIGADIGINWIHPRTLWSIALVARNIGTQLKAYDGAEREKLPFELQIGFAKQLPKAPFRFSIIGQQVQRFDITYQDPAQTGIDPLTGESTSDKITFGDKIVRHVIANVEVLLTKNFNLRFGYNVLRRNELGFPERKGMSGMTLGLGFKVNKFHFSYAHVVYNTAGNSNHVTLTTSLKSFAKAVR